MINWGMLRTAEDIRREAARAAAAAELAATDWYVTRASDPSDGRAIPAEVLERRRTARAVLREDEADG